MITNMDTIVSFKVLQDDQAKNKGKELDAKYKEALKDWETAKKEAKKNKAKFEKPRPAKPKVKILKKGLSEEKAQAVADKAEEDYEKKNQPKSDTSKSKRKK